MKTISHIFSCSLSILLTACSATNPSSLSSDENTAPSLLSETILYRNIATRTLSDSVKPFAPKFPLWSDGAAKDRWVYLPGTIDNRDQNNWVYPKGTTFFKQFSFHGNPAETRISQKIGEGVGKDNWIFATYHWRADGSDADLVSDAGIKDSTETEFPGVMHDIPPQGQCVACHTRSGEPVLGFEATQLDADRNEFIPHASINANDLTNEKLFAAGLLKKPVTLKQEELIPNPVELAAIGYLHGNCGSCHGPGGAREELGMFLRFDQTVTHKGDMPVYQTTIDVPVHNIFRIHPGDLEKSYIAHRITQRGNSDQMPPIATKMQDKEAIALIHRWIKEMK